MALSDDLTTDVATTFGELWKTRKGQGVPEPEALKLNNDAVELLPATVLYADLDGSTSMVDEKSWQIAAEVYKTYLHCATKVIRSCGGSITSFDGDRVMGIFIGGSQCTSAVTCALKINYAVSQILNPAFAKQYPSGSFKVKQVVGVDRSDLRAARTGIRGNNDIVWVGRAANYAAKLTNCGTDCATWITEEVYDIMNKSAKEGGTPSQNMWKKYTWNAQGGKTIYGSSWRWNVDR